MLSRISNTLPTWLETPPRSLPVAGFWTPQVNVFNVEEPHDWKLGILHDNATVKNSNNFVTERRRSGLVAELT